MSSERHIVIIGAGALGLGFIGPELSREAEVWFLDVAAKAELLERIERDRSYVINMAGATRRPVRVENARGLSRAAERECADTLAQADLCFTAVGEANLPAIAPVLVAAANRRGAEFPLIVLCAENGQHVASGLARRLGKAPAVVTDTVMGRMCRWLATPDAAWQPLTGTSGPAVAAEEFHGIPYRRLPGITDFDFAALRPRHPAEFALDEHLKLFGHNCLHGLFAYAAARRDYTLICEVANDPAVVSRAERLLHEELGPALRYHHARAFDDTAFADYAAGLIRRILSVSFGDTVERGIRGAVEKLRPTDRWVGAIRFVRAAGIRPQCYLQTLGDVLWVSGLLKQRTLGEVLAQHCGFQPAEISEMQSTIELSIQPGGTSWT